MRAWLVNCVTYSTLVLGVFFPKYEEGALLSGLGVSRGFPKILGGM